MDPQEIPQFRTFRKPTTSDLLVDYHCSVTPQKHKISTFKGEGIGVTTGTQQKLSKKSPFKT